MDKRDYRLATFAKAGRKRMGIHHKGQQHHQILHHTQNAVLRACEQVARTVRNGPRVNGRGCFLAGLNRTNRKMLEFVHRTFSVRSQNQQTKKNIVWKPARDSSQYFLRSLKPLIQLQIGLSVCKIFKISFSTEWSSAEYEEVQEIAATRKQILCQKRSSCLVHTSWTSLCGIENDRKDCVLIGSQMETWINQNEGHTTAGKIFLRTWWISMFKPLLTTLEPYSMVAQYIANISSWGVR